MKRPLLQMFLVVACASIFGMAASIFAQDGATLKGKFVFDGDPPKPQPIDCTKEPACCQMKLFDQSLVVGKNKELANVVVWVRTKGLKVPAELAAAHKEPVLLDNKDCKFEPRIVGLVKGQTLKIGNSDPVSHNSNIAAQQFNPIVAIGNQVGFEPKSLTLIVPNEVTCNIHPWMKGWVVVRPDPFFAISAEDGTFEIKGLPAGRELEFQAWQEKSGFVTAVKLKGKAATWAKGRFTQKLKAGENDLGAIEVAGKNFNK
jgi:plastocyanin